MASAAIVAASESEWIFPLSEYLSHDKTSRQSFSLQKWDFLLAA